MIDKTDKRILFELDKNCRRSVKEIAKRLKLKRDTVNYRIKQLEKKEIIISYYPVLDYSKLGYSLVRVYFKFQHTTPEKEDEMIQHLAQLKTTLTVFKTDGRWDVAIGFLVKSLKEMDDIFWKLQEKYRKYLYETNITPFLEYVHYFRNFLVTANARDYTTIRTGSKEPVSYDKTDVAILKMLAKDAKVSLLDIATKLELTSMAVRYRIKQLEKKGIILLYKPLVDYSKVGYQYYKVDLQLEDVKKRRALKAWAQQHPHVLFEDIALGGSDFEFDMEVENFDHFSKIINEIKETFPGLIRTYHYIRAKKTYKYVYFPE